MDNENEMNAAATAAENEEVKEETAASGCCCCCEGGVCTFTPPGEEDAPAEETKEEVPAEEPAAPAEEKEERPVIPVTQEMVDEVRSKLAMMLDYLGLEATVKAEGGTGKINLVVASADAGRIIGRRGQSLESLQLLINRMMQKNDVNYPRIFIDIDGYSSGTKRAASDRSEQPEKREKRDRRNNNDRGEKREKRDRRGNDRRNGGNFDSHDENLRMLAMDAAKEVRRWGDPKTLPEMNAHDRRIIHMTLENEADIKTDSVGEEPHKAVVISVKK